MADFTNKLERQFLVQDLSKEKSSDEDGGPTARYEIDSDFSYDSEEVDRLEKERIEEERRKNPDRDWAKLLSGKRNKNNTGPKAVKADYEEARRIVRRQNETKILKDQEAFKRAVYGDTMREESVAYNNTKGLSGSTVQAYDADDDEDEDEIIMKFRAQRLTQMRQNSKLPQFGRVIEATKFEFLEHVDNADPNTIVVTHLYEDYIANCRRMNDALKRIAATHKHVKFLRLKATEASQTLSHRALPAFLVYRAGQLVNDSSIDVVKHYFDGDINFTDEMVEWMLATKYGITLVGIDISKAEQDVEGLKAFSAKAEQAVEKDQSGQGEAQGEIDTGYISVKASSSAARKKQEDSDSDW